MGEIMCEKEAIDCIEDLFGRPLFKVGFLDFFRTMQEEGFDAAKNHWESSCGRDFFIPNATRLFEKLIDLYIILGFVPLSRYEKVVEETAKLKDENTFLRNAVGELEKNVPPSFASNAQEPAGIKSPVLH